MPKNNYLDQIYILTITDFKKRDQGTILGFMWSIMHPFFMVLVLYVIFSRNIGIEIEHFAFYLLIGLVLWNFFAKSTSIATASIVEKGSIVSNLNFKSMIIVISSILTIFISTIIELAFVIILILIFGIPLTINIIYLPLILLIEFIIILGISLILSSLYVFFQDIKNVWALLLSVGFFLTPIFYKVELIPQKFKFFILLNPLTWIVDFSRNVLLFNRSITINMLYLFIASLIILFMGYLVHKRLKCYFAEKV